MSLSKQYPLAALVGQDQLKTALLASAVDPQIGGVLVCGEKGTAKSTATRGLAALVPTLRSAAGCAFNCDPTEPWSECPHCGGSSNLEITERPAPFVDLPLGATEDRVLGTLDFERALREARRVFQPGLLAAAHRGILYIDEVNLLPDHLVDVLLDAAAMGVNTVQREGIEISHPARFILIGTMNPEEGELRPQLLDRFGLMVRVAGVREPAVRAEVVRRRLAYEASPTAFAAGWDEEQEKLRERIAAARRLLPDVVLSDDLLTTITRLCCDFEVQGLRADIALYKTSRALAALDGRATVNLEDVRQAAELVLPHRRRRQPFEKPGLDADQLDKSLNQPPETRPPEKQPLSSEPQAQQPGQADDSTPEDLGEADLRVFAIPPPSSVRSIEVETSLKSAAGSGGRRNGGATTTRGAYVRAVCDGQPGELALDATVRAAALRGGWSDGRLDVKPADIHRKQRSGPTGTLILFVVDASGSMSAGRRMEAVKGAVLGLLLDAYQQRDQVGVIAVRGARAELLLPPTSSVELAESALAALPTGGRTPLAHALLLAGETVAHARQVSAGLATLVVLLTDGKANVTVPGIAGDACEQAFEAARHLADQEVPSLVIDTDAGFVRVGRAREIAAALGAECLELEELTSDNLLLQIRGRRRSTA